MAAKFIFVLGGVVSGLGKGITAASLGRLLKARGMKVTMQKFDPYLNVDPGTMNPIQHGEVFVTDDGAETDLDLGHYERFIDESLTKYSNVTAGKAYWSVISDERAGKYSGNTIQVVPHITNEIKKRMVRGAEVDKTDIAIIEVGGTVGDIESLPFVEAVRQLCIERGRDNCMVIYVTLVPRITPSMELKTKPTQHSVKELLSNGIQPDVIVTRCDMDIPKDIREKIGLFCNVPWQNVIPNIDLPFLYEVPLALERENLPQIVCDRLKLPCPEPELSDWTNLVEALYHPEGQVKIAIVGKYTSLHDAYISVVEALKHGGIAHKTDVDIKWVDSETLTPENIQTQLGDVTGILVPGGFGERGIEGMILAAQYARENNVPYFGICLGMQIAVIEYGRHVANFPDCHSAEFAPECASPVIDLLPEQKSVEMMGATMRLGKYPCKLADGSLAKKVYGGEELIYERHRHRYELNNDFRSALADAGLTLCGKSPDNKVVEMIEIGSHPWFIAAQFHPEFKSRPNRPHPLFAGFIGAAKELANKK